MRQNLIPVSLKLPKELVEQVKKKADLIPLAAIIRRLLEKWVAGEIEL